MSLKILSSSTFEFGTYYQQYDKSPYNRYARPTPIRWNVIAKDKETGKILILSEKVLDVVPYYYIHSPGLTWENSVIRKWLNNDFYNEAFSDEEKEIIQPALLTTLNQGFSVNSVVSTTDNIFLLSIEEFNNYVSDNYKSCGPTYYAEKHGAERFNCKDFAPNGLSSRPIQRDDHSIDSRWIKSRWLLRNLKYAQGSARYLQTYELLYNAYVDEHGLVKYEWKNDTIVNENPFYKYIQGVRPALWITIEDEHDF